MLVLCPTGLPVIWLNQPSKNFMTFSVTELRRAGSCSTELCLDCNNYRNRTFLMLLAAAMFINNNRPSQNRQLLIRWAAKEINCDSSFFVWSEKIITTILLSLISLSSLELTGEVRRSDRQTDWLTVFKHPAVQHPSCVVRSHQTWQGQSQSQEHSLIRSKK